MNKTKVSSLTRLWLGIAECKQTENKHANKAQSLNIFPPSLAPSLSLSQTQAFENKSVGEEERESVLVYKKYMKNISPLNK